MKRKELLSMLIGAAVILTACGNSNTGDTLNAAENVSENTSLSASAVTSESEISSESEDTSENISKNALSDKLSDAASGKVSKKSSSDKSSKKSKNSGSDSSSKKSKSSDSSGSSEAAFGSAACVLSDGDEISGGTYTATGEDQSVFEAYGNVKASITGTTINKDSGSATSADDSSFKGVNSAVRAYGNATITLTDCVVTADADNATGVFAYENGTIYISDSTINVTGGGAGGIQVAGGGTLYAENLNVTSESKAAIRSDRGGGILEVNGGTYTSKGSNGCPAIYSTADITVKNADCTALNSRAVIIEGKNSVTLENCTLSGNDQSSKEGSVKGNVLLYQSASGDADDGTSVFTMNGGSMTSNSGAMFYCTNTASIINLSEAELTLSDDESLLIVSEGRWGKDGNNGGQCTLNASSQKLSGSITVDDISSLDFSLTDSTYEGAINEDGYAGEVNVVLGSGSKWVLTADSYITSFTGDESDIVLNGHKLYVKN